jgi:hypothetical protein
MGSKYTNYIVHSQETGFEGFATAEEALEFAKKDMKITGEDDFGYPVSYANGGLKVLKTTVIAETYVASIKKKSDLFDGTETEEEIEEILDSEWGLGDFDEIWDVQLRMVGENHGE